jgi:nucleotide-binding universal stress UspA family protein
MPRVNQILVPLDTHENAGPVVQWAALLAQATSSRLTLLHVNEALEFLKMRPGLHGGGLPGLELTLTPWRRHYEADTTTTFDRLVRQYCSALSVSYLRVEGRAHATILGAAESTNSDLVVMGTHGKPWAQRALLGSTAEAVVRASAVPVLLVPNRLPAAPPPRLQRLLLATDFSPASAAGEEWVRYLTQRGVREAVLVHAIENPLLEVYAPDAADFDLRRISEEAQRRPPRSAQPYWEHAAQVATTKLSQLRQQLVGAPAPGLRAEILAVEGAPASAILNATVQHQVDVIVMATHGRTGVRRLVLGSVTAEVMRTAPCPVLAVPSKGT